MILIFDVQKANILNRLTHGSITAGIPATILRNHPNAYIITTEKVAREAKIENIVTRLTSSKEAVERICEI